MLLPALALSSAFLAPHAASRALSTSKVAMNGGKGFGGGEATRDPAPTVIDPNDPKGKQQAIHKAESFAEYLAKRSAGGGAAPAGGSAGAYPSLPPSVKPGVLTGQAVVDLLEDAKRRGYAIPAVNCVTSSSVNACLEAAAAAKAPVMIQFSSGGAQFYAGKGLDNTDFDAAVAGAVSGAHHVRTLAAKYGVPVILHTDHCAKKLLPWVDGMLAESEAHYAAHGEPLFSSHMLDLSEEPLEENIAICVEYMQRMAKLDMLLEMELGITGGEEDGVDNENANPEDLYTKPEEVWMVQKALQAVPNAKFTIAAAFGNVHGVYAPGNVKLDPKILRNSQEYISQQLGLGAGAKPCSFVFHGGSGSDINDIKEAISYGVIKMNIDTDTQWAYWDGIRSYSEENRAYLQSQIGNPEGHDKPNKKFYDPRMPVRSAEETTVARLGQCFSDLNCVDVF
ncbi:aldolase A [Emiliania huxleyi CCMP1516]|uniref:fructose-bisphosphate aldolase n=3 Tax=Emiliania huxleyi TaxID=2903 RepID=A0A0D3I5U9_EMIH1|nr:aldolase A [Emiliania huxleyi CCMP1516]AFE02911.1 fructose-1,6-bisphosphate aldolase class II [Emiliania huxleyi]EOD06634.1 aldolase A [Emiliania huxleyi CCMP1516]|eukprot:XP_005759063.1 aldolase A [Emiliania huxleyi CCMP1516]